MVKVHSCDCKVEHLGLYTLELQCLLTDKYLILVIVSDSSSYGGSELK